MGIDDVYFISIVETTSREPSYYLTTKNSTRLKSWNRRLILLFKIVYHDLLMSILRFPITFTEEPKLCQWLGHLRLSPFIFITFPNYADNNRSNALISIIMLIIISLIRMSNNIEFNTCL